MPSPIIQSVDDLSSEVESFEQVNLSNTQIPDNEMASNQVRDEDILEDSPDDQDGQWAREDLSRFRVEIPEDNASAELPQVT